jgi:hypothetical protein
MQWGENPVAHRTLSLLTPFLFLALPSLAALQCGPPPGPAVPVASEPSAAPAGSAAPAAATALTPQEVDGAIREAWTREGLTAAPTTDDARFFRRLSVDVLGIIPTPDETLAFLNDRAPDKRRRAVEAMLASPRYAEHWTNYWDRVLLGREVRNNLVDRGAFRAWIGQEFAANAPWNKLVFDLMTATGQNRPAEEGKTEGVNGAVNWVLKYRDTPADLSGAASRVFLGVQIQCAQCHDHKTEKWKTEDFRHLTACFMQTKGNVLDKESKQKVVEVKDVDRPIKAPKKAVMNGANEYAAATPAALDGTDFSASPNRRQALASWLTAPQNPWFARAFVNRLWGEFLGRGFVDPVDDFRDSNPPVMPELLDKIAADFVAGGYDVKRLIRLITTTEVYQRSTAAPVAGKAPAEARYWSRFRLAPLGPDELLDSLVAATRMDDLLARQNADKLDQIRMQMRRQFTVLFDVDEDEDDDQFSGTIPQVLMLLNGRLTTAGSSAVPGSALADILAMPGGDELKIKALYLRTLSREPTGDETARWMAFLTAPREAVRKAPAAPPPDTAPAGKGKKGGGKGKKMARDPLERLDRTQQKGLSATDARKQAFEDLFWVLLNSSEFSFNH